MRLTLRFILTLSFLPFLETAITKFEGQNVTFQPNIPGPQIRSYCWTFMQNNQTEKIIYVSGEIKKMNRTRFEGRLDTDVKTGSITISNLNLCDNGTFTGVFSREGRKISLHIVELEVKENNDAVELDLQMGSNVTLRSKLQKLKHHHEISWSFGKLCPDREIANNKKNSSHHGDIFNNVILNLTNGDLTIPQITKSFSGKYYFRILKGGYPYIRGIYDVSVFDGDVNIPLGSNVTLRSTLLKLEENNVVSWLFGKLFPDREIANNKKRHSHHGDIFDNVILNLTNGDLTILQITKSFSGKYYFRILKGGYPYITGMHNVNVFDPVSVPNITKSTAPPTHSGCSLTCSVDNGPGVNLTWYRGNANVSCISNQSVSILTLPLHIQAEDSSTYSCQAQNPVSKQRKALDSQRLTCRNAGTAKLWVGPVIGGIIAATLVIIAVAAGIFTYCKKGKKGCHARNPLRSQSNQETSSQNCSSSLTSEEHLLQNVQGSSYETVK